MFISHWSLQGSKFPHFFIITSSVLPVLGEKAVTFAMFPREGMHAVTDVTLSSKIVGWEGDDLSLKREFLHFLKLLMAEEKTPIFL